MGRSNEQRNNGTDSPLQKVRWALVAAVPYPLTGERINIGILYTGRDGRQVFQKGAYQDRLRAFVPEAAVQRAVEQEVAGMAGKVERGQAVEDSRHLVLIEKASLVRTGDPQWPSDLVNQMVPSQTMTAAGEIGARRKT